MMKRYIRILLISGLAILSFQLFSQTVTTPYEVATWPGFRKAVVSFIFEDGCLNQLKIAVSYFNTLGLKLTLFAPTIGSPNWVVLKNVANSGHKIVSQTITHHDLSKISIQLQVKKLYNSKTAIENHILNKKCITIALPFSEPCPDSLINKYYNSAYEFQGFAEDKIPVNYNNTSSIGVGKPDFIRLTNINRNITEKEIPEAG